ncbi:MAG TPA: dienelactone hydrolase family protein [Actinomycetes bacterium]|jgi:dienelactone hydrolase|nr:dienelactone hydrolase family protein [Actinomycetes bacterium]
MSDLVLFHSVYGLRPAVHAAAERIRALGIRVHTPDLYRGWTSETVAEGRAYRDRIGIPVLVERARSDVAALGLNPGACYAGFSMGARLAQMFAGTDPATGGLVLLHGASDVDDDASFGYPIQLHVAEHDEFAPVDEIADWVKAVEAKGCSPEVFWYDGGHLYTDPELPDYDAESAELTWQRVEAFLTGLRTAGGG